MAGREAAALTEESARHMPPTSRATRTAKPFTRRRLTAVALDVASSVQASAVAIGAGDGDGGGGGGVKKEDVKEEEIDGEDEGVTSEGATPMAECFTTAAVLLSFFFAFFFDLLFLARFFAFIASFASLSAVQRWLRRKMTKLERITNQTTRSEITMREMLMRDGVISSVRVSGMYTVRPAVALDERVELVFMTPASSSSLGSMSFLESTSLLGVSMLSLLAVPLRPVLVALTAGMRKAPRSTRRPTLSPRDELMSLPLVSGPLWP